MKRTKLGVRVLERVKGTKLEPRGVKRTKLEPSVVEGSEKD